MKRIALLLVAIAVLVIGIPASAATTNQAGTAAHYIVFERSTNGTITPAFYSSVQMNTAHRAVNTSEYSQAMERGRFVTPTRQGTVGVTLLDQSGVAVYRTVVEAEQWLRGEFHGPDGGEIDGHFIQPETTSFVVRVPAISGTQLVLEDAAAQLAYTFDTTTIANNAALRTTGLTSTPQLRQSIVTGDPANRIDLVVIGEGYTAAQSTDFDADFANFLSEFFGIAPFDEYSNYVNVVSILTTSNESGADKPLTCFDEGESQTVDTALDATYCTGGIRRLLTTNSTKTFNAADAYPDYDEILVMINDGEYGGAGGSYGTFSVHPLAIDIAQHEYGHSFVDLADEYTTPYPGFPACSDIDGSTSNDCELNVTNETNAASIKWARWLSPGVPIPTTPGTGWDDHEDIGLFEGARYLDNDMYRPGFNCMMRALAQPFCDVASEAYVLMLYNNTNFGGTSVSNIEYGTSSPDPTGGPFTLETELTFSATLLGPEVNTDLDVTWTVNGQEAQNSLQQNGDLMSFTLTPETTGFTTEGLNQVMLRVVDQSPFIHPDMRDTVATSQTWLVSGIDLGPQPYRIQPAPDATLVGGSEWPLFTFTAMEGVEWYNIWVGTADYATENLYEWYPAYDTSVGAGVGDGICDTESDVCTVPVDIWLTDGNYRWWMTYWGPEGDLQLYNDHWAETLFSVDYDVPAAISSRAPAGTVASANSLTWDHDPDALWYQVWLGTADYTTAYVYNWFDARDICSATTCTLDLGDEGVTLTDGDYEWWIEVWGPAAYQTWVANGATNFTISSAQAR